MILNFSRNVRTRERIRVLARELIETFWKHDGAIVRERLW